jgi:hypothetical protein
VVIIKDREVYVDGYRAEKDFENVVLAYLENAGKIKKV